MGCTYAYIRRMSVAIVSIPFLEIGDFDVRIKQKTLSFYPVISPTRHLQRYAFFLTMQRSRENILSPKVNIFNLLLQNNWKNLEKRSEKHVIYLNLRHLTFNIYHKLLDKSNTWDSSLKTFGINMLYKDSFKLHEESFATTRREILQPRDKSKITNNSTHWKSRKQNC